MENSIQHDRPQTTSNTTWELFKQRDTVSSQDTAPIPQHSLASSTGIHSVASARSSALIVPATDELFSIPPPDHKGVLDNPILGYNQRKYIESVGGWFDSQDDTIIIPMDKLTLTNRDWKHHFVRIPQVPISRETLHFCGIAKNVSKELYEAFFRTPKIQYGPRVNRTTYNELWRHFRAQTAQFLQDQVSQGTLAASPQHWSASLTTMGLAPKVEEALMKRLNGRLNAFKAYCKFNFIVPKAIDHVEQRFDFLYHLSRLITELAAEPQVVVGAIFDSADRRLLEPLAERLLSDKDIFNPKDFKLNNEMPPTPALSESGELTNPNRSAGVVDNSGAEPDVPELTTTPAPTDIAEETLEETFDLFISMPDD
jgi:hypothetical protein